MQHLKSAVIAYIILLAANTAFDGSSEEIFKACVKPIDQL